MFVQQSSLITAQVHPLDVRMMLMPVNDGQQPLEFWHFLSMCFNTSVTLLVAWVTSEMTAWKTSGLNQNL